MAEKKYIVRLTDEERADLSVLINKGKAAAYKRLHASILLKADISEQGPGWTDKEISKAFDVSVRTVERVRERLVTQGLGAAIERAKSKNPKSRKLDGEQEAFLIALACSEAPEGYAQWSLRMLADRMVELGHVDDISHETIRVSLKKMK